MSDIPQAPDWWQANDGKWYPPQPGQPAQDPFAQMQQQGSQPSPLSGTIPNVTFGAPSPPGGKGCASIGVIIALITLVTVGGIIAFTFFVVDEANDAVQDTGFFDDAEEFFDDIDVTECTRDESSFNWAEGTIEVTNPTDRTSTFFVTITLESRNGNRQFGTANASASSLAPGNTTEVEFSSATEVPRNFTCTVTDVNRVAN
jgi:hypothetical protein